MMTYTTIIYTYSYDRYDFILLPSSSSRPIKKYFQWYLCAYLFCIYLFMVCLYVTMDVGSFLRKLFGEPARGANIFLFGPNKLHTTTRDGHAMMLSNTATRTNAAD
jgi:hypothetical protein